MMSAPLADAVNIQLPEAQPPRHHGGLPGGHQDLNR